MSVVSDYSNKKAPRLAGSYSLTLKPNQKLSVLHKISRVPVAKIGKTRTVSIF